MKSSVLFYAFQPRAEYEILNKCYEQRYEELGILSWFSKAQEL